MPKPVEDASSSESDEDASSTSDSSLSSSISEADSKQSIEIPSQDAGQNAPPSDISQIKLLNYADLFGESTKPAKVIRPTRPNLDLVKNAKEPAKNERRDRTLSQISVSSKASATSKASLSLLQVEPDESIIPPTGESEPEDSDNDAESGSASIGATENLKSSESKTVSKNDSLDRKEHLLRKQLKNAVHRQAKLAKKFEIRHVIRQLQKAKASPALAKKIPHLEEKLSEAKLINVENLESFAIKTAEMTRVRSPEAESATERTSAPTNAENDSERALFTRLLDHAKLRETAQEYFARPERERTHREKAKLLAVKAEEKEQRRLERLKHPLLCGFRMCLARFATDAALETHRIKRHKTTGDIERDIETGLRTKPATSDEKKAYKMLKDLKDEGCLAEINELLTPWVVKQEQKRQKQKESQKDKILRDIEATVTKPEFGNLPGKSGNFSKSQERGGRIHGSRVPQSDRPDYVAKRPRFDGAQISMRSRAGEPNSRHSSGDQRRNQETRDTSVQLSANKKENNPGEKLHPSWEAKRKTSQIVGFQGKVVAFDD